MFNILSHKGNANQNDTEISPHASQNGYHTQITKNAGKQAGGKGRGTLIHCWWEFKLVQPL
jgi:hypothetical protein